MYALIKDHVPEGLDWGTYLVEDIVEIISRVLWELETPERFSRRLRAELSKLPSFCSDPTLALKVVQSLLHTLHDKHPLIFPMFSAVSGVRENRSHEVMAGVFVLWFRAISISEQDPIWDSKLSLLRFCASSSEQILLSLLFTEPLALSRNIKDLSSVEIFQEIELQHGLFSTNALQFISGMSEWNNSNFFRRASDEFCPDGDMSGRWGLCEMWSEFFRDTPHVTFLFMSVLAVTSEAELAERFLSQLSRLAAEDSAEPHPHLKINLQIVGELLSGENRCKALPDALQTGRERYFQSLKIETQLLAGLIEAHYGVLVTT